jgi:hypothetical protein
VIHWASVGSQTLDTVANVTKLAAVVSTEPTASSIPSTCPSMAVTDRSNIGRESLVGYE